MSVFLGYSWFEIACMILGLYLVMTRVMMKTNQEERNGEDDDFCAFLGVLINDKVVLVFLVTDSAVVVWMASIGKKEEIATPQSIEDQENGKKTDGTTLLMIEDLTTDDEDGEEDEDGEASDEGVILIGEGVKIVDGGVVFVGDGVKIL